MPQRTRVTVRSSVRLLLVIPLVLLPATAWEALAPAPVGATAHEGACTVEASRIALDAEEQALLDDTNAYRAAYGLTALQPSYTLTLAALWKSTDMANREYLEHDDGFRSWVQRLVDCGYTLTNRAFAENLAAGNATAASTLAQFEASPTHIERLLDPRMTAVGIKRAPAANPADPYGWYWSMDLGSELDAGLAAGGASQ
jgi:uncharacterized protein YkwD